jgi:hypothetical protein
MIAVDLVANLIPLASGEDPDIYGVKMLRYLHFFNVLISVKEILNFVSFITVSLKATSTGTSRTLSDSITS